MVIISAMSLMFPFRRFFAFGPTESASVSPLCVARNAGRTKSDSNLKSTTPANPSGYGLGGPRGLVRVGERRDEEVDRHVGAQEELEVAGDVEDRERVAMVREDVQRQL